MTQWNFERSVTSMRLMAELAADHGMPLRASLAGTGLHENQLADSTVVVSGQQELRLIGNLVEYLGEVPALGIEAGKRYHFTAFGSLGFAIVSSPTARSALDVALRYFQLTFAFTRFLVMDTDTETHVTVDDSEIPEPLRRFIVERDMAALITVQRDLFSSVPALKSLSFRGVAPPYADLYEKFFGVQAVFGAKNNLAVIDRASLQLPLVQANELALNVAEEQCRKLLDARAVRSKLAASVRNRLIARTPLMPSMEMVAADLNMTTRTLRRRLLDEGTTFIELRDEVRLTLAEEFLSGPWLSVEQIAERLGYAEATSFINAFKRWHGCTPHAFRLSR